MIDKEWQSDFSLDRASWVRPCPTITSLGQQVGQGGICHPEEDRLFTINELSRLMGLPDDYSVSSIDILVFLGGFLGITFKTS